MTFVTNTLQRRQVVVQRLQQWCAEAAAQFAERSLEEEFQVKPKAALLKRGFFWGEELDVAETEEIIWLILELMWNCVCVCVEKVEMIL